MKTYFLIENNLNNWKFDWDYAIFKKKKKKAPIWLQSKIALHLV